MSKKTIKTPQVNSEVQALQDQLARSRADYSNLEKRIDAQRQMFVTLTTVGIISKMIEVLDDLYLTQKHLNDSGLQITINKFFNVLKSEGLEEIKTDTDFNHETMHCIAAVDGEENKIISVEKKGYTLNGQVIRPAQVIVGKNNQSPINQETNNDQ